ncbi:hypothetical protein BYT27DRAFT_7010629, partial [Phlegmacium glaucopus]
MNTVNKSTGYSPFQLKYGRSPRIIPSFTGVVGSDKESVGASDVIALVNKNVADARDNLLLAKISQAKSANERRGKETRYRVGDMVMLSTTNRRMDFKQHGDGRVAK